jgi:VanZ family protein
MKSKNLHVGTPPTDRRGRLWAWGPALLIAGAIFVASSLPRAQLPQVGFPGIDKLEHGLAYALLGAALARGWYLRRRPGQVIRWTTLWFAAWLLALGYGLSDELHQLLVPGRMFDLADLLADAIGAGIGAAAYLWQVSRHVHRHGTGTAGPLPGKDRN